MGGYKPALSKLAKRIKEERIANDLTQKQLAKRAKVSESHISSIECGECYPSVKVLIEIAKGLNTSVDYLLSDSIRTGSRKTVERFKQLIEGTSAKEQKKVLEAVRLYLSNEENDQ